MNAVIGGLVGLVVGVLLTTTLRTSMNAVADCIIAGIDLVVNALHKVTDKVW